MEGRSIIILGVVTHLRSWHLVAERMSRRARMCIMNLILGREEELKN